MKSFFEKNQTKKDLEVLYQKVLNNYPKAYEMMWVETSFGDTHIIQSGGKEKQAMVWLSGPWEIAPVILESKQELTDRFCLFVVDIPEELGFSAEKKSDLSENAYGQWMYEISALLNINNAVLVGQSFAGFVCWKTLTLDEKRISKTFFINPLGIIENTLPAHWERLLVTKVDFRDVDLQKVLNDTSSDQEKVPVISEKESRKINTPVYFAGSVEDPVAPGDKLLQKVVKVFPALQDTLLLRKSGHFPVEQDRALIIEFIMKHTKF